MKFNFKKRMGLRSKNTTLLLLLAIIILIPLYANLQFNFVRVNAHSAYANPTEIFSLWNNTSPFIDGTVDFSFDQLSADWSSAAVYWMYDNVGSPNSHGSRRGVVRAECTRKKATKVDIWNQRRNSSESTALVNPPTSAPEKGIPESP